MATILSLRVRAELVKILSGFASESDYNKRIKRLEKAMAIVFDGCYIFMTISDVPEILGLPVNSVSSGEIASAATNLVRKRKAELVVGQRLEDHNEFTIASPS